MTRVRYVVLNRGLHTVRKFDFSTSRIKTYLLKWPSSSASNNHVDDVSHSYGQYRPHDYGMVVERLLYIVKNVVNVEWRSTGHVALVAIIGNTKQVPYTLVKTQQLMRRSNMDGIYGYPIFKWVVVTWQTWKGTSIIVLIVTIRKHSP